MRDVLLADVLVGPVFVEAGENIKLLTCADTATAATLMMATVEKCILALRCP